MPTYDYICDGCQHEFEAFESIKADPQKTCPNCGQETLRRKLGPGAAVIFKGSGFYQTDYRSESYKKAAKADSPGGADSTGKSAKDSGSSGAGGPTSASGSSASSSPPPSSSSPSTGSSTK
jgi:putative FmdB family regulatory protein